LPFRKRALGNSKKWGSREKRGKAEYLQSRAVREKKHPKFPGGKTAKKRVQKKAKRGKSAFAGEKKKKPIYGKMGQEKKGIEFAGEGSEDYPKRLGAGDLSGKREGVNFEKEGVNAC